MTPSQIQIIIEEASHPTVLFLIDTPVGRVEVLAEVALIDKVLVVTDAHIEGLSRGALGRSGLNAIGAKVLEMTDADLLVVEGAARTTGANPHRRPKLFRYPRGN